MKLAPNKRLIVKVPDRDVAITTAAEADLWVRTDGKGIAGCCCRRKLCFHTWRWLQIVTHNL